MLRARTRHHDRRTVRKRRAGITATKVVVVVGVLALLTPFSLMAFRSISAFVQVRTTQNSLLKIDEVLHQRIDAFNRWIESQKVEPPEWPAYVRDSDREWLAPLELDADDPEYRDVVLIVARKNRFREFFPQENSEVPSGSPYPANLSTPAWENAECLYHFIANSEIEGAEPLGDDYFGSHEVGDVDGDGQKEFVDPWGNTIRFYRWPTRLVADPHASLLMGASAPTTAINGADGQPGVAGVDDDGLGGTDDPNERGWPGSDDPAGDPDDPQNLIPKFLHKLATLPEPAPYDFEARFHAPATFHTPLLVSAGPDGIGPMGPPDFDRKFLGMYEPINKGKYGHLAVPEEAHIGDVVDNITNLNSRAGGR